MAISGSLRRDSKVDKFTFNLQPAELESVQNLIFYSQNNLRVRTDPNSKCVIFFQQHRRVNIHEHLHENIQAIWQHGLTE